MQSTSALLMMRRLKVKCFVNYTNFITNITVSWVFVIYKDNVYAELVPRGNWIYTLAAKSQEKENAPYLTSALLKCLQLFNSYQSWRVLFLPLRHHMPLHFWRSYAQPLNMAHGWCSIAVGVVTKM